MTTPAPLLLAAGGDHDPEFRYACRFGVEDGLYLRFGAGDDLLVVSILELERARSEGRAARIEEAGSLGWRDQADRRMAWAELAARLIQERGGPRARISPSLPAGLYEALRSAGLELEIVPDLFIEERRRKDDRELEWVAQAQAAAEAATLEVIREVAAAQILDGVLLRDERPLTSEWLMARAQQVLIERGCICEQMIIAGGERSSQPHFRGQGELRAGEPIVIDIFPRHQASGYCGDLTRTVVPGGASELLQRMHGACLEALEVGLGAIAAGADGRDAHRATCQRLVDRGFGTTTSGLEGEADGPRMIHSTGHGVGLEVHEAPPLRNLSFQLAPRDVVTVEPGLYQAGVGGVRVEDLVVVAAGGFDNLTSLPKSLDPADYL
jgi:Xaa-Pro aminopeptidase